MRRPALLLIALLPLAACGENDTASGDATGSIAEAAGEIEAMPPASAPEAATVGGATVVDVIGEAQDLTTLRRLLRESGLAETLASEGPYTLFAPSDAALADLDTSTMSPEAIRALLLGHALSFRTLSADMDFEQTVETIGGTQLSITPGTPPSIASGGARASIVRPDLDAANGVVHVIDGVLPAN